MERSRPVNRWSRDSSRSSYEPPNMIDLAKSERQRAPCRSEAVTSCSYSSSVTRKLTRRVRILRMGEPPPREIVGKLRKDDNLDRRHVASPLKSHSRSFLEFCPESCSRQLWAAVRPQTYHAISRNRRYQGLISWSLSAVYVWLCTYVYSLSSNPRAFQEPTLRRQPLLRPISLWSR